MSETKRVFEIAPTVKTKIDHWLSKYPPEQAQSALIPALLLVQAQNDNWLSNVAIESVADYLGIPHIAAFEVATFYDMYNVKPVGKHKIALCTNISCMLRGSDDILACLEKKLGIRPGETTKDGQFTLQTSECLAACVGAPMCQIDDQHYHEHLTPEKMEALIDGLMTR